MTGKFLLSLFAAMMLITSAWAQTARHEVKSGDTLFSIARQYDISVEQLREWNDLGGDGLSAGQMLVVRSPQEDEGVVHNVEAQETLFSLSKQYGVSIAEIQTWNNLAGNSLSTGQQLVIYPGESQPEGSGELEVEDNRQNNTYYTVKSGDSLYRIAREHNMTVEEIRQLNDLESDNLSVGQQLTVRETEVPPSVGETVTERSPQGTFTVWRLEENRSLQELLEQFEMDESEFRELNPELTGNSFRSGERITVLVPPGRRYSNPYRVDAGMRELGSTPLTRYSSSETGNTTTAGELYSPRELTAAHSNIALGTIIFIRNPENGKGVFLRINDRISGNGLKLSQAAWNALAIGSANPTADIFQDQ